MTFLKSKEQNENESTLRFRYRFLEIGSLLSGITAVVGITARYLAQSFPIGLFLGNLTLGLIVLGNGLFVRRWKNILIPASVFVISFMLIGINSGLSYGGFYAPAVATMTLCPLFAGVLGGRKFSSFIFAMTILSLALLYIAGATGMIVVKDPTMELGRLIVYQALSLGLFFTGLTLENARKSTENDLLKKELQLRTILDSSSIGKIVANKNFELIYKNHRAEDLLRELGSSERLPEFIVDSIRQQKWSTEPMANRYDPVFEFVNQSSTHSIRFKIFDFSFNSETEKNILINMIDETDSVRAVEMQKSLTAKSKMAALGEMASGIAHEINNPLAIIFGKCAVISKHIENNIYDSTRVIAEIEKINFTAGRIEKIVSGLLNFAREGSRDQFSEVTIESLIENTLSICKDRFLHSNVNLSCTLNNHGAIVVRCLPSQISQVLVNLLNNAFDELMANPEFSNKMKWVRIEVRADDNDVELNVIDAGHGLSEAIKEKIFFPFFTTKPVGSGTGLGLSISKGLIENHGGSLTCGLDPINKTNTCFSIKIPKRRAA